MVNSDIAYTAMCLWEEILEKRDRPDVAYVFEHLGTCAVRSWVLSALAPACEEDWNNFPKDKQWGFSFDWEFVPQWIDHNVDWNNLNQIFDLTFIRKKQPDYFHLGSEAETCVSK